VVFPFWYFVIRKIWQPCFVPIIVTRLGNFRLFDYCFLGSVFFKVSKKCKFWGYCFPWYQLCISICKKLFGPHFGRLFHKLIWPTWYLCTERQSLWSEVRSSHQQQLHHHHHNYHPQKADYGIALSFLGRVILALLFPLTNDLSFSVTLGTYVLKVFLHKTLNLCNATKFV
jgi:hypothetical protein